MDKYKVPAKGVDNNTYGDVTLWFLLKNREIQSSSKTVENSTYGDVALRFLFPLEGGGDDDRGRARQRAGPRAEAVLDDITAAAVLDDEFVDTESTTPMLIVDEREHNLVTRDRNKIVIILSDFFE